MSTTMGTTLSKENQDLAVGLAVHRDYMDARQTVKDYAARILRSACGIGAGDRQWLHDVKRDRVNIRSLVRLLELATAADLADALYGPMAFRAALVRELVPEVPLYMDATRDEEEANHFGNLSQFGFTERPSLSTLEELRGWMDLQAVRSLTLADAATVMLQRRITVVSR